MYIPAHFAEPDVARARALVLANSFGMLVVPGADGAVEMAHLPFLLDAEPAPLGTLRAHVARANPIASMLAPSHPVIAVFSGPHAYVSPRWYENPRRNVPTWNYAAVHAHGVATRIDERSEAPLELPTRSQWSRGPAGARRDGRMADRRVSLRTDALSECARLVKRNL